MNKLIALIKYGRIPTVGDKEFKKEFLEFAYGEVPSEDIANAIRASVEEKLLGLDAGAGRELSMAARAFFEMQEKLYVCYAEACELEWQLFHFYDLHRMRGALSTHETQRMFVARTEILAQQLYAAISSFIRLLLHLKDGASRRGMPDGSVSGFLGFAGSKYPELLEHTKTLKRTTNDYRGKYVDHQNEQTPYDWYTCEVVDRAGIVYYSNKDGVSSRLDISDQLDGFPMFEKLTMFPASSAFVPPHHTDAMRAYVAVVRNIL